MKKIYIVMLIIAVVFTGCTPKAPDASSPASDDHFAGVPSPSNAGDGNYVSTSTAPAYEPTPTEIPIPPEPTPVPDEVWNATIEQHKQAVLSLANNDIPCDQLITQRTPFQNLYDGGYVPVISSRYQTYGDMQLLKPSNEYFWYGVDPKMAECVRDMGGGNYYAVFEPEEGGRIFTFMPKYAENAFSYNVYVDKPKAESEYDKLKIGDSIDKVIQLDPAFAMAFDKNHPINTIFIDGIWYSYHLLANTLILIQYDMTNYDGKKPETRSNIIISQIQKFPDKKLVIGKDVKSFYGYDIFSASQRTEQVEEVFDFNILPQDYPT